MKHRSQPSHNMGLAGKVLLATALLAILAAPGLAAPLAQPTPFPTPTPGPDGRIIYIVQPEDTLFRISAISGVSVDEIRALNNLGANDIIVPGTPLLLGLAGPAIFTATPGATFTPQPQEPTPTPDTGSGQLCILLFEDLNGDSLRQTSEPSIPGGAISISDRSGEISLTETTPAGLDPVCFDDLIEGDYNITVAAPEGYNPTTVMNYALRLEAGDATYLDFGSQKDSETLAEIASTPVAAQGNTSSILGILGVLLVLGGIGLGFFAARSVRR